MLLNYNIHYTCYMKNQHILIKNYKYKRLIVNDSKKRCIVLTK